MSYHSLLGFLRQKCRVASWRFILEESIDFNKRHGVLHRVLSQRRFLDTSKATKLSYPCSFHLNKHVTYLFWNHTKSHQKPFTKNHTKHHTQTCIIRKTYSLLPQKKPTGDLSLPRSTKRRLGPRVSRSLPHGPILQRCGAPNLGMGK